MAEQSRAEDEPGTDLADDARLPEAGSQGSEDVRCHQDRGKRQQKVGDRRYVQRQGNLLTVATTAMIVEATTTSPQPATVVSVLVRTGGRARLLLWSGSEDLVRVVKHDRAGDEVLDAPAVWPGDHEDERE